MDLCISLPVAETSEVNEEWHRLLDEERARAERTSDAWIAAASEKGDTITLQLKPASAVARVSKNQREADRIIVFTEDGWFDSDKPQTIQRQEDGSLTIRLIKATTYLSDKPPRTLRAIVRNDEGWLKDGNLRCLQVAPKIER
jgi:thiol:disulfide interchange protein DsbD